MKKRIAIVFFLASASFPAWSASPRNDDLNALSAATAEAFHCDGKPHLLASGRPTLSVQIQLAPPAPKNVLLSADFEGTFSGLGVPIQQFELDVDGKNVANTNIAFNRDNHHMSAKLPGILVISDNQPHRIALTGNTDNIDDATATLSVICIT